MGTFWKGLHVVQGKQNGYMYAIQSVSQCAERHVVLLN